MGFLRINCKAEVRLSFNFFFVGSSIAVGVQLRSPPPVSPTSGDDDTPLSRSCRAFHPVVKTQYKHLDFSLVYLINDRSLKKSFMNAFGMLMPGRKFDAGTGYRYGFNGEEKDKDITNGDLDFGARIYDSRLGRWLSVDPLQHRYANLSPYNGMGNNPILFIDPSGKTIIINAQNTTDVNKIAQKLAFLQITKKGSEQIHSLHISNDPYYIKAHNGVADEFTQSSRTLTFDPNEAMNNKGGYYHHSLFSFGHEIQHAYDDVAKIDFYSVGSSEAKAVNMENYYRSVFGLKNLRKDYDFGWWDKFGSNHPEQDDFVDRLENNPNSDGESVKYTSVKVLTPIKEDKKATYAVETVGTFDADSKEVKEATEGSIYFFDYKKDKNSEVEKKAVIIKISVVNGEKN